MIDLDALEKLAAQATPGPWEHVGFGTVRGGCYIADCFGLSSRDERKIRQGMQNADYIVAACNAVPELVKMYREAEDKANNAWRILLEAQGRIVEVQKRVRELERQREFFLKALNDNRLCPSGGCFHDGSDLDEWDCTSFDNRECWIHAAKESGND